MAPPEHDNRQSTTPKALELVPATKQLETPSKQDDAERPSKQRDIEQSTSPTTTGPRQAAISPIQAGVASPAFFEDFKLSFADDETAKQLGASIAEHLALPADALTIWINGAQLKTKTPDPAWDQVLVNCAEFVARPRILVGLAPSTVLGLLVLVKPTPTSRERDQTVGVQIVGTATHHFNTKSATSLLEQARRVAHGVGGKRLEASPGLR